jgi:hypothetical protein
MPDPQGPSPLGNTRTEPNKNKRREPNAPGYDKKLDGPNRPST